MKWLRRSSRQSTDFREVPLFEILNGYSHKRGTVNIGNPAIIWHRAYWRDPDMDIRTWHGLVNGYIELTLERLRDQHRTKLAASSGGRPDTEAGSPDNLRDKPEGKDLAAFYIGFEVSSARITIVFEKFDEFWSIKTIADFSHVNGAPLPDGCFLDLYRALAACEQVIVDGVNAPTAAHANFDADLREHQNALVREQSRLISHALLALAEELFPQPRGDQRLVVDVREMFAHFVGFSLGLDNQKRPDSVTRAQRLATAPDARVVDRVAPTRAFSEDAEELGNLVDAIWPVAKWLNPMVAFGENGALAPPASEPEDDQLKREFTISRLNRGRALYITSLGGMQAPPQRNLYFPLSYLLVCPHKASWQIGRIVDRLHTLGLFRLAILRDYNLVEKSNQKIGELMRKLNDRSKSAGAVSSELDALCSKVPKGLHHRIEWSRYYRALYDESKDMLNFEKVEGYQTYPEFVSRKFSGRFHTIENVGRRLDHLSLKIRDRINQSNGISIRNLLTFAEIAGIIPIAYYSRHLADFIVEFMEKNPAIRSRIPVHPIEVASIEIAPQEWLWLSILAAYLAMLLRWKWRRHS